MKMEGKMPQENNPWADLSTITTFDKGSRTCSTRCVDESEKEVKDRRIVKKVSTSSILIGSLIRQLCSLLEKDPSQSKKLYSLLCDTMHKMKLIDPSYKLGGFEFVQKKYVESVYQLITVARATIGSENSVPIPRSIVACSSPYQEQFQETGFIAAGGFGNVFKAVHKLDEVEYAIKKIVVRPGRVETIMSHLEEVKTLAKLNHTNIVSYKQAWVETMTTPCMMTLPSSPETESDSENNSKSSIRFSTKSSWSEHKSYSKKSKRSYKFKSDKSRTQYSCASSGQFNIRTSESTSDVVSFKSDSEACDISIESHSSNVLEINTASNSEENNSSDGSSEGSQMCQYSSQTNQYTVLYIQMGLCEKTLRQWLDERTESTSISMVAAIATQILCGLNYIHSLKIVHHDIKPSNIFITTSGKLQVQLGDFGLACPLQRDSHDAIVGTCMYAAPEQLKGQCNPKSDVYSLGIVLLELLIPMQTSMECIRVVQTLQNGEIPSSVTPPVLNWAKTISRLIEKNPSNRPSTNELLEEFNLDRELTITKLQDENDRLKEENSSLKEKNSMKDQLIEEQKMKIEELELKLAKLEDKN